MPTYQFSNATKSILENQLQVFSTLTSHLIEATEKLHDLNMAVVKASVDESSEIAKQLLSVKDQAELLEFISEQPKQVTEKLHFYNQHVAQISSHAKSNIDQVLEKQLAQAQDGLTGFVAELTQHTPAGSEDMIAVFKSAIDQTNASYQQMNQAAQHVAELIGSTIAEASKQFVQSLEKSSLKTAKK